MKKFMNFGVLALLGMALTFGMTSCSDDDPDYSNVTPPTVELANANISGMITTIGGNPIAGAEVTAKIGSTTLTATTNADGEYEFEELAENGTYIMEATASGKQTMTGSVTVAKGETGLWSTRLPNEATTVSVSQTEETSVEVVTETLENNEDAKVTTVTTIPAAAVEEGEEIIVTSVYGIDNAVTKASVSRDFMLMGINISCSNPNAVLKAPIKLTFNLNEEVIEQIKALKEVNGNWVNAEATMEDGKVVFTVDAFTTYSLFVNATLSQSTSTESISFTEDEYNNLYGAAEMSVGEVAFTYKQGAEITNRGNGKLAAFLLEALAQRISSSVVKSFTGSYPVNVSLPIGTALNVTGTQEVNNISISIGSSSVSAKSYGNVKVTVNTYNRQHNGGTN